MSLKYSVWAWDQETGSHTAKLVLLKLADNANDNGQSWYPISKMLVACELSDRAFRNQLRKLEELALLTTEHRENRPSVYALPSDLEAVQLKRIHPDSAPRAGGAAPDAGTPAPDAGTPAPDAGDPVSNPVNNAVIDPKHLSAGASAPGDSHLQASLPGMTDQKAETVPCQAIIDLFNEKRGNLPKVMKMTTTRQNAIKRRWADKELELNTLEAWAAFFDKVNASAFLQGWKGCGLDWLLEPKNMIKVMEGNYSTATSASAKKLPMQTNYANTEYQSGEL